MQKNIFDLIHIPTLKSKEIIKRYFNVWSQKFIVEPWGICKNQINKITKRVDKNVYYIAIALRKEKVKRFEVAQKMIEELNTKRIWKFILNVYWLEWDDTEILHYKWALKNNEVLALLPKNDFILSTSYFDTFSISLIEGMSKIIDSNYPFL